MRPSDAQRVPGGDLPAMNFNIGDRVRVSGWDKYWDGRVGEITGSFTRNGKEIIIADFDGIGGAGFREDYLILIKEFPVKGLDSLPQGLFIGANRYDTDVDSRLHLWTADGQSFDIVWEKKV